jgi:glycosyltransferase involved in cell wall biosynthesis
MPRSIVQVVQHLSPGGIETMALDLCRFAPEGTTTHVVSLEGTRESALAAWGKLLTYDGHLHFLDKRAGIRLGTLGRLIALLRRLDPIAVHTHHVGPLLYGGVAARIARVPVLVHTEHDAWHLHDRRRRRLQHALVSALKPILVADADHVAAELEKLLPGHPYHVIRNGIDTGRFTPGDKAEARKSLGLPPGKRLIGCAARLEPVKGHHVLLGALRHLPNDVHLALAGNGSLGEDLRSRVRDPILTGRVHFLGRVDDMPNFNRSLDLFCLPSFKEGMPLSLLEAQAAGVPCVVSDVGGCSEALCPETGHLVQPGDIAGLASTLTRALERPPTVSPRDFVCKGGGVRRMAKAYGALYSNGDRA